ncbi:MAG: c-type cytochrome [Candidatus Methylomirabilales bacterium]
MRNTRTIPVWVLLFTLLSATPAAAHEATPYHPSTRHKAQHKGPTRITMEELHRHGGTPPGWTFTVPAGDPQAGRGVFIKLECYSCHRVEGETFPSGGEHKPGPDLTGMGGHHPAPYLAEAILDPNAVIVTGPGFTGKDGRSIMPSYADLLTLEQWVNLVAYLKSLTPGHAQGAHPHAARPPFYEGEGEVRLVNLQEKFLVVKHGAIRGFMGAMTMGYPVRSPDLLKGLEKGDRIQFTIDAEKEVIIKITPVKSP